MLSTAAKLGQRGINWVTSHVFKFLDVAVEASFSFRGLATNADASQGAKEWVLKAWEVCRSTAQVQQSIFSGNTCHFSAELNQNVPMSMLYDIHNFNSNSISCKLCLNRLPAGQYASVVPVHRAHSTVEFLCQETPDFISLDMWPTVSPHLITVECKQEHTRSQYVTWPRSSNCWKSGRSSNRPQLTRW